MPGPLDALERFMEEAVEGTAQRLFRPSLQPVQLAKAAAREMDGQQSIGPNGPEVPNHFTIGLHPKDFEHFARFQVSLQRELARYLEQYAADRGWHPVSDLVVLLDVDGSVRRGRPRVRAEAATAVLVGPEGERFILSRPVVRIGRALENDVVIDDTRVSRFHAEIRRVGDGYLVRDLGSTNGTLVAEEAVGEATVREGETISLGGYPLTFRQLG